MNHKFYCVNVSNTNNKKPYTSQLTGFILEKDLKEIYDTQYNDIFPKILSKTKSEFISLLKDQVFLHLKIINKKTQNSLNSKFTEIYTKKYFTDKTKVTKGLEDLIKNPELQGHYLNVINCFIHCHKCSTVLHKCNNKLVYYKNYIYCLQCQKVYNENQIKLFCQECKACYYTKIRYVINKRFEHFYPVSFTNYHCALEEQEKIKCLECGNDLYYNITYENNNKRKNAISEVFCLKCKLLYDLNEIFFKCKICNTDFKSQAQIYSSFSTLKIQFLYIMHTLSKKRFAVPEINLNRKCKCNISKYDKYVHEEDNGVLYLGHNLEGQYIIICDGCYSIFKYDEFLWNCPLCGINFKSKKIMTNIKKDNTMVNFRNKRNEKNEKKQMIFKSPSHMIINKNRNMESGGSYQTSAVNNKTNSSHIVKNIFVRSDTKYDNNKNTKIILLTNNYNNSERKVPLNLNLSEQKVNLSKKIKNINLKNNNFYNSVNYNYKDIEIRKPNTNKNKSKNIIKNNTLNSLINNISFSGNKCDSNSNSNKCTDSTAHITYRNYEKINEEKNFCKLCRCPSCILEDEYKKIYSLDKNRVNRKLEYDDVAEESKDINYNRNNNIKKSKTCMETENNENKKVVQAQIIKRFESRENLIKNKRQKWMNIYGNKNEDKRKKESQLNKTAQKLNSHNKFAPLFQNKNNIHNHNNDSKKINISLYNNIVKDSISAIDSLDNNKNIKTESSNIVRNNLRNYNSQNKIKCIKRIHLNNIENSSQNRLKNIKSLKFINANYYSNNHNMNKSKDFIKKNEIKIKEIKEKKPMLKQLSKFKSQNKDNKNNKNIKNNINNNNHHPKKNQSVKNEKKLEKKEENKQKEQKEQNEQKEQKEQTEQKEQNEQKEQKKQKEQKDKKESNSNSIFNKIKQYYEDCIIEEENLFENAPKLININSKDNKNISSTKKKIEFKTDFKSDNYTILKLLGKGTYGKTYLVEDPNTKERFALKKIIINDKMELKQNQDEYNLILQLLKDYPDLNIINIYGIEIKHYDKYNTVMYVLMEAANCDWEKEIINRCAKNAFYRETQLVQILTSLVKTFSILQKNGISHRDVKPQNILCFGEKGYKISDFGEAKNSKNDIINKKNKNNYLYQDNTMKQTLRGTELYMSPILFQALRTKPYKLIIYNSYKSDVFSLGMCFFLASCLDYEGLYEVREIISNPNKTKFVVNRYLNMKYSQKYINLLISMLQIYENDRPDFIELEKIIDNIEF